MAQQRQEDRIEARICYVFVGAMCRRDLHLAVPLNTQIPLLSAADREFTLNFVQENRIYLQLKDNLGNKLQTGDLS